MPLFLTKHISLHYNNNKDPCHKKINKVCVITNNTHNYEVFGLGS